jgi:hypothetical protein
MRAAALLLFAATAAAQTEAPPPAPTTVPTPKPAPAPAPAQRGWEVGAVLDVAHTSRMLALGQREQGLALGHSDVSVRGPLGAWLSAQATVSAHQHDGKLEAHVEEAWLQTRSLPAGLQLRAGRFASQIGYLNEQHPHADDFVERPLLYRAFLGGHWFDDGLRLNWTAPTPFYLRLGAEVFRGRQLVEEAASARRPGAVTLGAKLGGDIGDNHSWQFGASYLHNRREAAVEDEPAEGGEGDHDHAHDHAHGARFGGRKNWYFDAAWKWAPEGNNRQQQLKVVGEVAQITDLNRFADGDDRHRAASLSVVWRFRQDWEVGARTDWLRVRMPHGDHFHSGRLAEDALMVAWKPSHMQALRLQFTSQRDAKDFEDVAKRAVQLQYVLAFGAHGAHSF